jgi:hypothetical protein
MLQLRYPEVRQRILQAATELLKRLGSCQSAKHGCLGASPEVPPTPSPGGILANGKEGSHGSEL